MKNLVIVESPSKSKTIGKYLGKDYLVVSSKGHIRDLAIKGKDGLGVDIENDFTPIYEISKDKVSTVKELRKLAEDVDYVYLATDPDREGEAISWHLAQELGLYRKHLHSHVPLIWIWCILRRQEEFWTVSLVSVFPNCSNPKSVPNPQDEFSLWHSN